MPEHVDSYFLRSRGSAADIHNQLRTALEPALGISTEGPVPDACNVVYARHSKFRPLAREVTIAYEMERVEGKAAKSREEAEELDVEVARWKALLRGRQETD